MANVPVTLSRFIIEQQTAYPEATGEFSVLLTQIGLVGKLIARDLRRAGLIDVLGTTGETNVQGEVVKRLDMIANDTFLRVFEHSGLVCVLASEEMEKPIQLPQHWPKGKYMLLFDPLDGSSNTDVNMPLGAIFSILKHDGRGRLPAEAELFRKGTEQVAAGYLLFGSSTMLVFSVGQRVHGFTLDPSIGEYLLSHENIRIPKKGKVYAANEGNYHRWLPGTQKYVDALKVKDKAAGRPYSARYSGCLVADVHRILLGGGSTSIQGRSISRRGSCDCSMRPIRWPWWWSMPAGKRAPGPSAFWTWSPRRSISGCRSSSAVPKTWNRRRPLFRDVRND